MQLTWDFIQYVDELNHPVSENTENIFECSKCHLMIDHGYRNNENDDFLCSVCFKKERYAD